MDYGIFNMHTDVNACDCMEGGRGMDTVRESALKVDPGRKIPCHMGDWDLRWQHAGPMLYQLSYLLIKVGLLTVPDSGSRPSEVEQTFCG